MHTFKVDLMDGCGPTAIAVEDHASMLRIKHFVESANAALDDQERWFSVCDMLTVRQKKAIAEAGNEQLAVMEAV